MAAQGPTQCKNDNNASWMFNDRRQNPCQLLSSTLQQFDPSYTLNFLGVDFTCPSSTNGTAAISTQLALPSTSSSSSAISPASLQDACCSTVMFSLFSACWVCQRDLEVTFTTSGRPNTATTDTVTLSTWQSYASQCPFQNDSPVVNGVRQRGLIGTFPEAVSNTINLAGIQIPPWAFIPVSGNSTWNEADAKANATLTASSPQSGTASISSSKSLSKGCIAGITLGTLAVACLLIIIGTITYQRRRQKHRTESFRGRLHDFFYRYRPNRETTNLTNIGALNTNTTAKVETGPLRRGGVDGDVEKIDPVGPGGPGSPRGRGRSGRGLIGSLGSFGSLGSVRFSAGLWKFGSREVRPTENARLDLVSDEDGSPVSAKERQAPSSAHGHGHGYGFGYTMPTLAAQVTRRPSPLGNQVYSNSQPNLHQNQTQQQPNQQQQFQPDLYHSQAQALSYQLQAQQQLLSPQHPQTAQQPLPKGQVKRAASGATSSAGSVGGRLRASFRKSLARINDGISVPLIPTFKRPANTNGNNAGNSTNRNAFPAPSAWGGAYPAYPATADNATYTHTDNMPGAMLSRSGSNRFTHPMTNPYYEDTNTKPYSVPLSPTQMAYSQAQMYPLTTSHSAPHMNTQFNANANVNTNNANTNAAEVGSSESFPLTKEALAMARVAQDGSLFVPADHSGPSGSGGKVRGRTNSGGKKKPIPDPLSNNHLVRTISIERTRAMRHAEEQERERQKEREENVPERDDSLRNRLLLHDPDRPVPRRTGRGRGKGRGNGREERPEDEERETSPTALFDPHNQHLLALIPKENQEIESLQPLARSLSDPLLNMRSAPSGPRAQQVATTGAAPGTSGAASSRLVVVNAGPASPNASSTSLVNLAIPANPTALPTTSRPSTSNTYPASRTAVEHLHNASLLYPAPTRSHTLVNRVMNAVDLSIPAPLSKRNLQANLTLDTNLGPNGEQLGGSSSKPARPRSRSKSKEKAKKENHSTKATHGSASTNTSTNALVGAQGGPSRGGNGNGRINLDEEAAAALELQSIINGGNNGGERRPRGVRRRSSSRSRERRERKERRKKKQKSTKVSNSSVVAHASSSSLNDGSGAAAGPSGSAGRRRSRRRESRERGDRTDRGETGDRGRARERVLSQAESGTVMTSPSAGNGSIFSGHGIKSDGSRTPSPKIAPSAEWFDLFRKGTARVYTPAAPATLGSGSGAAPGSSTRAIKLTPRSGSVPAGQTHIYLQSLPTAKPARSTEPNQVTPANQSSQSIQSVTNAQPHQVRTKDAPLPPLPPVSPASPVSPTALRIAQLFSDPVPKPSNSTQPTQPTPAVHQSRPAFPARPVYQVQGQKSQSELPYYGRSAAPSPAMSSVQLSVPAPPPLPSASVSAPVPAAPPALPTASTATRVAAPRGARERPVRLLPTVPGHRGGDSSGQGGASLSSMATVHGYAPVHGHGIRHGDQQSHGQGQAEDGADFERRRTVR